MTRVISAPGDLVVASSDGIDVRFAGFEFTSRLPGSVRAMPGDRGLKINVEGVRGLETQRRDVAYDVASLKWAEQWRAHGAVSAGPPPTMPGVLVLQPIQLDVKDEAGTEYRFVEHQAGGSGTEWSASWIFLPEPPENARNLYLEFSLRGAQSRSQCQIQLD
jgi:hypothetical protein